MSFFYNRYGDAMKLYLDLIFLINFGFDFLLLLVVSYLLRRNVSIKKICFGALLGGMSIFFLFIPMTSFLLFILKVIVSIGMILITFSYKNRRYFFQNLFYLYTSSMILGGFLYFLNVQFSYKQQGLIFFHNGLSVNMIFLIVASPIILYIYVKQGMRLKNFYANTYSIKVKIGIKTYFWKAFMDTGNRLTDPYFHYPVVLVDKQKIEKIENQEYIMVPVHTIEESTMIPCIRADTFEIVGMGICPHVWIGICNNPIQMEGIDCLLHPKLMEESI